MDEVTPDLNIDSDQPKQYGRPNCSSCGKPREPEATAYSYCVDCGRKKQRKRYRDLREAAGYTVSPRSETPDGRRDHLYNQDGKPGPCECCGQPEPDGLVLVYEGDPVANLYDGGTPFALMCRECHGLLQQTNSINLRRLVQVWHMLQRFNLPRERVLPDLNTFLPTATPSTKVEQKSP